MEQEQYEDQEKDPLANDIIDGDYDAWPGEEFSAALNKLAASHCLLGMRQVQVDVRIEDGIQIRLKADEDYTNAIIAQFSLVELIEEELEFFEEGQNQRKVFAEALISLAQTIIEK